MFHSSLLKQRGHHLHSVWYQPADGAVFPSISEALSMSGIGSFSIWFTSLQFTFGVISALLAHCVRYFIPPDHDWKVWSNFRAMFQDSWRPWDKGFLVVDHFFLDSPLLQNCSWSCSFSDTLTGSENVLVFLCIIPEVSEDSHIVAPLSPTFSGRFDCRTLLVRCKSSWPKYRAFMVTVPIHFSIFLDSGWLSGNVQTLLFPGEECHFHTWEIEPNEPIGPVEQIPKWMYY